MMAMSSQQYFVTNGKEKVLIATAKGYGISFSEEEVRSMGRVSRGVKVNASSEGQGCRCFISQT